MQQKVDMEILQHILEQFSEDILNDCSKIITRLLNSLNETSLLQDHKIITSIKVLLNLYENICANSNDIELIIPSDLLIQIVKKMLCCGHKSYDHLDENIQVEVLSITKSVIKILCLKNSSEALEKLAELHKYNLTCISSADEGNKCKSDCLLFNIKMVHTIYSLLENMNCETSMIEFSKKSMFDNMNECEVFMNLVFNGNSNIAIQTLMFVIPSYIKNFKNYVIFEVIWEKISNSVTNCSVDYSKAMLILCNFFDETETEEKIHFALNLFEDANYWELLESSLVKDDPMIRKQGMYLFKKTVNLLNIISKTINCSKENISFYWDVSLKSELHKIYSDIITILEFLDEQQLHIIKPIFKLAEVLFEKVMKCNKVNLSWLFLIYHKALTHESIEVIKWGLTSIFNFPMNFFMHEKNTKKTVEIVMPVLNSLGLYYNNGIMVSQELRAFFRKMSTLDSAKVFFCFFIEKMCSLVWSPEALFFVTLALNLNQKDNELGMKFSFWGEDEISQIKIFIMRTFKTFHKTIRTAIQCELLSAITAFTDNKNVSLKNVLLLISSFPLMEYLNVKSQTWSDIKHWLHAAYSKQEFNEILNLYKKQELGKEFNEKFLLLLFIISYQSYSDLNESKVKSEHVSSKSESPLLEIFLLFKDIDRRLYCDRESFDYYLSLISNFYEANQKDGAVVRHTLPFVKDLLLYIRNQLKQIVDLQEFHTCQLYLNAFKNITKIQKLLNFQSKEISSLYMYFLNDLEMFLKLESKLSPVGLYSRMSIVNILLRMHPYSLELNFLVPYLLAEVNKPLQKDRTYSDQTKDIQTLWGKMNSEFIEAKWTILEYFIKNKMVVHGSNEIEAFNAITDSGLVKLCVEGLTTGGYGILSPIMSILKDTLLALENYSQLREIISSVWKLLMERKKTEEFKLFVKGFVEMLFQEKFILKGESAQEILTEYAHLIFSSSSLAVVNIFMRHIQKIDLAGSSLSLFCYIIGRALIFGPVERKDERLTKTVCFYIDSLKICPIWDAGQWNDMNEHQSAMSTSFWNPPKVEYSWPEKFDDYYTSTEVRARAVVMILALKKDSPADKVIAKGLMETLIKLESDVNKNRKRYFGDSHVHRVKHRVMQGLLLLDHLLCLDDDESKKLLDWLCNGLMVENPQPSVRYQQEWLIIRLLIKNSQLYNWYNTLMESEKFKKKGDLCSYVSILLHFYRLLPPQSEFFIDFSKISNLLVHPHFEVRLYAQVVFLRLYEFAKSRNLTEVINKWEEMYFTLSSAYTEFSEKQLSKHFLKLSDNFFFTIFHPINHYSLQTIYLELPSATNVSPDEWISAQLFTNCGLDPSRVTISLITNADSLKNHVTWKRTMNSYKESEFGDQELEETSKNYQKKIIPTKPFISDGAECNTDQILSERKDGLVVVASLIDRIPNLGGLARTCEIFGASEYVLGSLKYTEDKQFTSLSVTAEKWITVKEVKQQDLKEYILKMKQNGYTVVGAEQTLHSHPLNSVKFPEKTLLLLGNEKEGIYPNLLPFLDICVEIPQVGIIRSLNVHVTGALFIWEYAKQRFFS